MKVTNTLGMRARESSTSYNIYGSSKNAYTDGSKSRGKKVGYAGA